MPSAPQPKRILILCTEVFANGGIQRFNQTLLSALVMLGAHCDVLSLCDSRKSIDVNTLPQNIHVTGFDGARVRFALGTLRAVWSGHYEWIIIGHINLLIMTIATLATRPFTKARTICIAHGIEVWYRIGALRKLALMLVSTILCVSKYTRQRILDQVPSLHPDRFKIFPNALWDSWRHV